MNEPIISPYIIYLLSIVDNIRNALFIASLMMMILLVLAPAWTDGFTECVKPLKKFWSLLSYQ